MNYLGDFPISSTVRMLWNTNGQDGASITRSTNGTLKIYKDIGATERSSLNGVTQVEDFASGTGVHSIAIDLSDDTDAGFYAAGHEYHVVMTGMVIDTKTVNAVIAHFSIERSGGTLALLKNANYGLAQLVRSTTPANTLSVDVNHLVAVPATQKVDVETIKTNAVVNGGTITFPTGATLASTTNITGASGVALAADQEVNVTKVNGTAQTAKDLGALNVTALNTLAGHDPGAALVKVSDLGTVQTGDSYAVVTNVTYGLSALNTRLVAIAGYIDTEITTILDRIGAWTGTGVNTILGAFKALLSKAATNPSDIGGTFDAAADSTEAIRDRGDAAWITGAGGDPWATNLPGAYTGVQAGKIIGDNLNATVSSRSTLDAAGVWGYATRTLSSFSTLVSDIATAVWGAVTRTLTGGVPVGDVTLAAAQPNYAPSKAGDAMALTPAERTSTATAVWASAARTLTSFSTLVSDIATAVWSYITRTLTTTTGDATAANQAVILAAINDLGDPAQVSDIPSTANIAAAVWSYTTRTLTSFVTLVADIAAAVWAYVTRTLTTDLLGSGAIPWTITVQLIDGTPISDVDVWITTDLGGDNVVASGRTDIHGHITFYLDAGSYYCWCQKAGENFSNPATITVTA